MSEVIRQFDIIQKRYTIKNTMKIKSEFLKKKDIMNNFYWIFNSVILSDDHKKSILLKIYYICWKMKYGRCQLAETDEKSYKSCLTNSVEELELI